MPAPNNKDSIDIITHCTGCNKKFTLSVNENEFNDWKSGLLIQKAMPKLSPDERESLISGTCRSCWDKMFEEIND